MIDVLREQVAFLVRNGVAGNNAIELAHVVARERPERYPGLLVRVSAYFADLTPEMQDEIIRRTKQNFGASRCG